MPSPLSPDWWLALPTAWVADERVDDDERADLAAMMAEGLAGPWDRPDGRHWCLTPWGAVVLGLRVGERAEAETSRVEVWDGPRRRKHDGWTETRKAHKGEWDLRRDGSFIDRFRAVAVRVVHEEPCWAPADREERPAVVAAGYKEMRGLNLDWLPGRPVETAGGELAEALEIEGEPVVLWGRPVVRAKAAKALKRKKARAG